MRGKLYIKDKKYDKALLDFKTASDINPQRSQGTNLKIDY